MGILHERSNVLDGVVLVTGSRGFTGVQVCQMLRVGGCEVHELVADIKDSDALTQEVQNVDPMYCIHLAGVAFTQHTNVRDLYEINLLGTINLLNACLGVGVKSVLLASSGMLYDQTSEKTLTEESPISPKNHYCVSKLAMEHAANLFRAELPLIIARPFNYTGRLQTDKFVIPKIVKHFKRGEGRLSVGNTHVLREFNDVRDVARIYIDLILQVRSHAIPINICTGDGIKIADVIDLCKELTGSHIETVVDTNLVRQGEPLKVTGDPSLLRSLISVETPFTINETLEWMLSAK